MDLENCAQQKRHRCGTLKDWYHGTLGVDLENVVMGGRTFQPWREWIQKVIDPLYNNRYNELMRQLQCKAVDMQVIALEEDAMPEVED
jgi:dihydrofolate reductase